VTADTTAVVVVATNITGTCKTIMSTRHTKNIFVILKPFQKNEINTSFRFQIILNQLQYLIPVIVSSESWKNFKYALI
jgi:hypothetical protein